MKMEKTTIVFIALILPIGLVLAFYASEASLKISSVVGLDVTRETLGVVFLVGSIILLKIVSILERRSKNEG